MQAQSSLSTSRPNPAEPANRAAMAFKTVTKTVTVRLSTTGSIVVSYCR